jgi:uncharacterized protein YbcC (UPF0753/DUF2309 family)
MNESTLQLADGEVTGGSVAARIASPDLTAPFVAFDAEGDGGAADAADVTAAPEATPSTAPDATLATAIAEACRRIAPLWPLESSVAVNPFLGFADRPFAQAAHRVRSVTGARTTMPRGWYREPLRSGRITDADLDRALRAARVGDSADALAGLDAAALRALCERDDAHAPDAAVRSAVLPTLADVVDAREGTRWGRLAVDEISKWCAAYYDEGQSAWRMPWQANGAYAAWRAAALHDRTPEVLGLRGFRAAIARLPTEPRATIAAAVAALGVPAAARPDYLHRLLATVGGWSAFARQRAWQAELRGDRDDAVEQVLAIRAAWDAAVAACAATPAHRDEWRRAVDDHTVAAVDRDLAIDLVLHDALEHAWERDLTGRLSAPRVGADVPARPAMQAVFCIDVRSEVFRRALEGVAPDVSTHGFAGFFGFALEYVPLGSTTGTAQCPVLLKPAHRVRETVQGEDERGERRILDLRRVRRRAGTAWKSFRTSAVSCFPFVETAGLLFGAKLVGDAFALTRTVEHPSVDGVSADVRHRLAPEIVPRTGESGTTGLALDARIATAAGALAGMGLTKDFARLVLLCGHGSTTVNNPYAAGLDCGACGGHTGEANARVAARVLNDPAVRAGLAARGLAVPADTLFVAGLHDTTTDDVRLFDTDDLPPTHAADLARLHEQLARAGERARTERAALLGIAPSSSDRTAAAIRERTHDWAQVRPEWGLAGNAAFVAAPRALTRGRDLGGRAFLHDYDVARDPDGSILELILTAPMVVASWINLQYYASTVDNAAFGSGNKVLHNVVGTFGVLEGNGGDLRTGLPWQSVHDGRRFVHEPLRLHVLVAAPRDRIDRVLAKHANVAQLVANGWVKLYAFDGDEYLRSDGGGGWTRVVH